MSANVQAVIGADPTTVPSQPRMILERFMFTGTGEEYFRIWIVNLALTLATLGVYSAWAKVRRLRYFYGCTQVGGASFQYHGQPLAILKGRLLALAVAGVGGLLIWKQPLFFFLYILLIGIFTPFLVVRGRLFRMRMTSYRNLRFDFQKDYSGAYRTFFWLPMLSGIIFFLYPYVRGTQIEYLITRTRFGNTQFWFNGSAGMFFPVYIVSGLIFFAGYMLFVFVIVGGVSSWWNQLEWVERFPALAMLPILLALGLGYLPSAAYLKRGLLNTALGNIVIGSARVRCELAFGRLFGLYLRNSLLMIATVGLYYPWARVNLERYKFDCLSIEGNLEEFIGRPLEKVGAAGEELSEFLDVDIGL
jgi:uncharacterized membrane protein YjgN (DUF898 family)